MFKHLFNDVYFFFVRLASNETVESDWTDLTMYIKQINSQILQTNKFFFYAIDDRGMLSQLGYSRCTILMHGMKLIYWIHLLNLCSEAVLFLFLLYKQNSQKIDTIRHKTSWNDKLDAFDYELRWNFE